MISHRAVDRQVFLLAELAVGHGVNQYVRGQDRPYHVGHVVVESV